MKEKFKKQKSHYETNYAIYNGIKFRLFHQLSQTCTECVVSLPKCLIYCHSFCKVSWCVRVDSTVLKIERINNKCERLIEQRVTLTRLMISISIQ